MTADANDKSVRSRLTTAAGILHACLAGFFAVLGSIARFIRKIGRITVGHWRRDVICLAHHVRESVLQQKSLPVALPDKKRVCRRNRKIDLLLRLAGYMRRVQAYRNKYTGGVRTVLYMVLITRGILLPLTSLPLRCTSPPTERSSTESPERQIASIISFVMFFFFFVSTVKNMYVYYPIEDNVRPMAWWKCIIDRLVLMLLTPHVELLMTWLTFDSLM